MYIYMLVTVLIILYVLNSNFTICDKIIFDRVIEKHDRISTYAGCCTNAVCALLTYCTYYFILWYVFICLCVAYVPTTFSLVRENTLFSQKCGTYC